MSHSRTDFYYLMIKYTQRIANIKPEKPLAVIFNMNKMETSSCAVVTQLCHATPFLSLQISCVTRPHNGYQGDYL